MNRSMNRKGDAGDSLMFFAFFFLMIIIGGGISLGLYAFYGQGHDFRQAEADVLGKRVEDCFMKNDFFEAGFNETIYKKCGFNKGVIEKDHLIYVRNQVGNEFFIGVLDYKNQCFFKGAEKNKNFPRCAKFTITKSGQEFEVIVGSNQNSRSIIL
ncbi:MAG: hypothetical protein IIA87_00460 [Nanoarchaeota archaeon]|nr:hypothetical protein [Nanoarchaeota archaeon]